MSGASASCGCRERALAAAYDLDGAFNSVAVKLRPGQPPGRT